MDLIEVLPRLRMLRFPVGAAYLWRDGDELTLIDTGTADCAAKIEEALDGELRRIVLTHWHEDHTGAAAELAARHGAEVVAHRLEAPVIRGEVAGAPPVLEEFEVPIREALPPLPSTPPCRVDREVEDGDVLAFGDGAVRPCWVSSTPTAPGLLSHCTGWPVWRRIRRSSDMATRSPTARQPPCKERPPQRCDGGRPFGCPTG
jgi:glyoxylase-like metal-dependent hydrolase (beta-lactamase superfamily II)